MPISFSHVRFFIYDFRFLDVHVVFTTERPRSLGALRVVCVMRGVLPNDFFLRAVLGCLCCRSSGGL